MQHITILVEYPDEIDLPSFQAHMQILGGTITAVQFGDLFADYEKLEE